MAKIGMIGASYFMVTTIMMYILGKLSDLKGLRNYLIIFGLLGSSIVYFLLSISNSTFQLLILMVTLGLTTSAYQPSMLALVSENKAILTSGKKMGFYNASMSAGFGFGVIFGGLISDIFKLNLVFILCSVVVIFGLFSLIPVLEYKLEKREVTSFIEMKTITESLQSRIVISITSLFKSQIVKTGLIFLCIAIFFRNGGFRALTNFLPLYLIDLGASQTLMGAIISVNFIAQIFLMPPAGWFYDFFGRKITISIGMLTSSIAMFLFSLINEPAGAILIQLLVAFSWSMILTSANAYVADFIPRGKMGGGMGLMIAFQHLGGAIGPTLAGFLVGFYGYRVMLQVLTILPLLGLILSITKLEK